MKLTIIYEAEWEYRDVGLFADSHLIDIGEFSAQVKESPEGGYNVWVSTLRKGSFGDRLDMSLEDAKHWVESKIKELAGQGYGVRVEGN